MDARLVPGPRPIRRGDSLTPSLFFGARSIAVPLPPGTLPEAGSGTLAEIRASLERPDLPGWMNSFSPGVLTRLTELLARIGPIEDTRTYTFDLHHRLDDFTFVGAQQARKLPFLRIVDRARLLRDVTGEHLLARLRRFRDKVVDDLPGREFLVEQYPKSRLGPELTRHRPALLIDETIRVSSAFDDFEVGSPAGTVTLVPGEKRTFSIKTTSRLTSRQKEAGTIIEKATRELAEEFQRQFELVREEDRGKTREVRWTELEAPPGSLFRAGAAPSKDLGETSTLQELAKRTIAALETIAARRTRETSITISREYERSLQEAEEELRKVEVQNTSRQSVTFVYHYLNALYRVNVDLVGIRLRYTGASLADGERAHPLRGELAEYLVHVVQEPSAREAALHAVLSALRDRYGALEVADLTEDDFVLKPAPEDRPGARPASREAHFGERPPTGPLPVTLRSRDVVQRTMNLHNVPRISECAVLEKDSNAPPS